MTKMKWTKVDLRVGTVATYNSDHEEDDEDEVDDEAPSARYS